MGRSSGIVSWPMSMGGAWYAWRTERGREELRFRVCGPFTTDSSSGRLGDADLEGGAAGGLAKGGLGSAKGSAVEVLRSAAAGFGDGLETLDALDVGCSGAAMGSRWPRMKERTGEEARWQPRSALWFGFERY